MRRRTDDLSPAERQLLDDVDGAGLHVVHVPARGAVPACSFSVGLWESFQQPEVLVLGLPHEVAGELIEVVADEADAGQRFLDGTRHEGLLEDYPVRFVEVPKSRYAEFLAAASWAYEGADFPAVQLVWPDKQGRWPWDPEARAGFAASQPVLGRAGHAS
ncbi:MAG: DUF4262 domain-containing protein [Planctomycetes bacterium]|nr:DUF4262 domain-containing protein [Planctomycetota bacterium]